MSSNIALAIKELSFSYETDLVLEDINLKVNVGETVSLIGPSGFGKTTLLQLIAGDLVPNKGSIQKTGLWRRVFQHNALFPWLNVEENIKLGLRGVDPERALDFNDLIKLLDLGRVLKFYPRQLSGGLRQRTEIARALIGKPDVLLLDEPFSSLDYFMRHETKDYLATILKDYPITMIIVTHDIPEAIELTQKTYALNKRPATIVKEYNNCLEPKTKVEEIWNDLKFHETLK